MLRKFACHITILILGVGFSTVSQGQSDLFLGLSYSAQHTNIAQVEEGGFTNFWPLTSGYGAIQPNKRFGLSARYVWHKHWGVETGIHLSNVSGGYAYDASDSVGVWEGYCHEEMQYLKFPLLVTWSTNSRKNFQFHFKLGAEFSRLLYADNYFWANNHPYYVGLGLNSDYKPQYVKRGFKEDPFFDQFLDYAEYEGVAGVDIEDLYTKSPVSYYWAMGFSYRLNDWMQFSSTWFINRAKFIHDYGYAVDGYNFWQREFSIPVDQQIRATKNFGFRFEITVGLFNLLESMKEKEALEE